MKKIFILSLLPLFIVSCKAGRGSSKSTSASDTSLSSSGSTYVDPYTFTKEEYEEQLNRDYVLTKANYYLELIINDVPYQYCEIATGRMHSYFYQNQVHYYGGFEIVNEDLFKYTMFNYDGQRTYDYYTKEYIYSYVFGNNGFYFDIPYEVYSYDEINHVYKGTYQKSEQSEVIEMELHVKNHLPEKMIAIRNNTQRYEMTFSKHGNVEVIFPDEQN